jgi:hypothetical protein
VGIYFYSFLCAISGASLRVLVGCEESQAVCRAFRIRGHEAYSNDLEPTRGDPAWHLQGDVLDAIAAAEWDLIILHPDCTAMAVSGNGTYGEDKPRHHERAEAVMWTLALWDHAKAYSPRVALENPKSIIFNYLRQMQYIQPSMFGHRESKETGLALHNLPFLRPTDRVEAVVQRIHNMGQSSTRKRDRSETYPGIAAAMAEQWGILNDNQGEVY